MLPQSRIAVDCGTIVMTERPVRQSDGRARSAAPVSGVSAVGGDARPQPSESAQPRGRPARRPASVAQRLAAEVDRLEAELAAMRARLADLEASAERDPLTRVLNRRGFERELARALAYLSRYEASAALAYLDLDGFKPVNDRHGHAAGDAVLVAVAQTLNRQVRASDSVGRLGGDEFAVLLWNIGEADADAKARVLEAGIAGMRVVWNGAVLTVGASVGIALLSADETPAALMARADAAMYARKTARQDGRAGRV